MVPPMPVRRSFPARVALRLATMGLLAPLLLPTAGCNSTTAGEAAAAAEALPHAGSSGARVSAVSGPGGLLSDALYEGTFLGKGAKLSPGQHVETPKGTLCELELDGGVRVRLNEQTSIELPGGDHPRDLALTRGEAGVIAPTDGSAGVVVAAGDETLRVGSGEAQVRNVGATRHFAV